MIAAATDKQSTPDASVADASSVAASEPKDAGSTEAKKTKFVPLKRRGKPSLEPKAPFKERFVSLFKRKKKADKKPSRATLA